MEINAIHYRPTNCDKTISSVIAEGQHDALCQLKFCQLAHNCTKNSIENADNND